MAVRYYDEALLNKIKNWVKDPNMTITSVSETRRLFEYNLDVNNDKPIKLPLIALRRDKSIQIINTNRRALTYEGLMTNITSEDNFETARLNYLTAIPIDISYQLDIYTRYEAEADEYVRNFVFNFINYPQLMITIPYNGLNFKHVGNVRLAQTITDNSDIGERLAPGQFTRFTLEMSIDDAYLFSSPIKQATTVEIGDVEVKLATELSSKLNKEIILK